jgi:hypothetical protein
MHNIGSIRPTRKVSDFVFAMIGQTGPSFSSGRMKSGNTTG